jgi:hypothetical protein
MCWATFIATGPSSAPGEKLIACSAGVPQSKTASASGSQNSTAPHSPQNPRCATGDDRYHRSPRASVTRHFATGTEEAAQ